MQMNVVFVHPRAVSRSTPKSDEIRVTVTFKNKSIVYHNRESYDSEDVRKTYNQNAYSLQ